MPAGFGLLQTFLQGSFFVRSAIVIKDVIH